LVTTLDFPLRSASKFKFTFPVFIPGFKLKKVSKLMRKAGPLSDKLEDMGKDEDER
jgi:hypothetical protein